MIAFESVSRVLCHGKGAITAVVGNTIFSPALCTVLGTEVQRYLRYVKVSCSL